MKVFVRMAEGKSKGLQKRLEVCYFLISVTSDLPSVFLHLKM